jgi:hypothetical protein
MQLIAGVMAGRWCCLGPVPEHSCKQWTHCRNRTKASTKLECQSCPLGQIIAQGIDGKTPCVTLHNGCEAAERPGHHTLHVPVYTEHNPEQNQACVLAMPNCPVGAALSWQGRAHTTTGKTHNLHCTRIHTLENLKPKLNNPDHACAVLSDRK